MKGRLRLGFLFVFIFSCLMLAGCSKKVDVDLNNYVSFEYDGFDGNGTVKCSVDYNKILTDHEETLGEKNSMSALRILRKIEVETDKDNGLSNNDTINVKWGKVDKDELLNECGINATYSDFTSTVSGLKELEKIDLFKDLDIRTDGYDTLGSAYIYSTNLPIEYWFIDFELEKDRDLSNGDKIKIVAEDSEDNELDKKLAEKGKAALSKEYTYTVTGLTELLAYDPFDGVTLKFKGVNGNGTAEIEKDYLINDYVYSWEYSLSKTENLSNGDVVTITVSPSYAGSSLEKEAAQRGLKMIATTKDYTVSGLSEPLTDIAMLDEAVFEQMKANDINKIEEYFNKGEDRSVEPGSLKGLEYIGSIIIYQEATGWTEEHNSLYNFYRCDVKCSFDEPRWVYWYSLYDGITKSDDGGFIIPEPKCPSDNYSVGAYSVSGELFVTDDNTHFYLGYKNFTDIYQNHISWYESYVVFNNVNDEAKDHVSPAYGLVDITDANGIDVFGMVGFSGIGCAPIYSDGTYTITLKLADLEGYSQVPEAVEGLSSFRLRFLNSYENVVGEYFIDDMEISDISVVCDGKPVDVSEENMVRGYAPDDIAYFLFDNDMGLTGKKAAVKSKGFGFKETLEITFTVTGIRERGASGNDDGDGNVIDNGGNGTVDDNGGDGTVDDNGGDGTVDDNGGDGTVDDNGGDGTVDDNGGDGTVDDNGGDGATDGTVYEVVIEKFGEDRTRMIKLVNDYSHIGLMAARDMVDEIDALPVTLTETDDRELAEKIKNEFAQYGAEVTVNLK